ncbi:hypothetical protein ACQ4M3_01105 [Leptolyngbya sp. AN03gr2]|uniref:hypothetical protein n=1 Tax=unclassified Leptolyngbya TaxID=2650499 RepID=UPI003D31980A
MIRKIQQITAVVLVGSIAITATPRPAKAQVQILAPALCSTGVGCIFVGVAVVGGIAYYVWQGRSTGKQHYLKIEDPGNIEGQRETHAVATRSACREMEKRFQQQGRRVTLSEILDSGNPRDPLRFVCVFQGKDATPGYYDRYRR